MRKKKWNSKDNKYKHFFLSLGLDKEKVTNFLSIALKKTELNQTRPDFHYLISEPTLVTILFDDQSQSSNKH